MRHTKKWRRAHRNFNFGQCLLNKRLRFAVKTNNYRAAVELIDLGAQINSKNVRGITVLRLAVQYNSTECVKLLCQKGVDVNRQQWITFQHNTIRPIISNHVLFIAIGYRNLSVITYLLQAGTSLEILDGDGSDVIRASCHEEVKNNTETLDYFIKLGVDLNHIMTFEDMTNLSFCVRFERPNHALSLLRAGANVNKSYIYGKTLLEQCCQFKKRSMVPVIVELLLNHSCNDNKIISSNNKFYLNNSSIKVSLIKQ